MYSTGCIFNIQLVQIDLRVGARITIGSLIRRVDRAKRPIYKGLFYIVKKWHIKNVFTALKNSKYAQHKC